MDKENGLENETPTEVWESLHEWEKEHNPFYPMEMRHSRESLTQFAEFYATLKTSQLKEQLEKLQEENNAIRKHNSQLAELTLRDDDTTFQIISEKWNLEEENALLKSQLENREQENKAIEVKLTWFRETLEEKDREIERLKGGRANEATEGADAHDALLDARGTLIECRDALGWALDSCKPDREELYSDFFNILTNTMEGARNEIYSLDNSIRLIFGPHDPPSLQENTKF